MPSSCKCMNNKGDIDTFCYLCGKIKVAPTDIYEGFDHNKPIRFARNIIFPKLTHRKIVLRQEEGIQKIYRFMGNLMVVNENQVSITQLASNNVLNKFEANNILFNNIGYLRPNLIVPTKGGVYLFHVRLNNSAINTKFFPDILIQTPPVIYDNGTQKKAIYNIEEGLFIIDNSFTEKNEIEAKIINLELKSHEKLKAPVLIENNLFVMTSSGRYWVINIHDNYLDGHILEPDSAVEMIDHNQVGGHISFGTPIRFGKHVVFETFRHNYPKVVLQLNAIEIENKNRSNRPVHQIAEILYSNLTDDNLAALDEREIKKPICDSKGNLFISDLDYQKIHRIRNNSDFDNNFFEHEEYKFFHWNAVMYRDDMVLLKTPGLNEFCLLHRDSTGKTDVKQIAIQSNQELLEHAPLFCEINNKAYFFFSDKESIHFLFEQ